MPIPIPPPSMIELQSWQNCWLGMVRTSLRLRTSRGRLQAAAFLAAAAGSLRAAAGAAYPASSRAAKNCTGAVRGMGARASAAAGGGVPEGLSDGCTGAPVAAGQKLPLVGDESIMSKKAHGTTATPVQPNLRWGVDQKVADKIVSFNRHYAEYAGYYTTVGAFMTMPEPAEPVVFRDSVTGLPLFEAPKGRSWADFMKESRAHGWPSFRDEEVVWENVRVLRDGEAVSTAGSHLGHNLPDASGNRYCINLVSVAGNPPAE